MARSTARKRALNTLYEADEKGQDILSLLAERLVNPGAQTPLPDYSVQIVRGVAEHERDIDDTLNACSRGWIVPRMPVVDRNILRIGTWEIMYNDEIPEKVAIDEALALAKSLCDANSPSFIHGVLAAVSKRPVPVTPEAAQDETEESVAQNEQDGQAEDVPAAADPAVATASEATEAPAAPGEAAPAEAEASAQDQDETGDEGTPAEAPVPTDGPTEMAE